MLKKNNISAFLKNITKRIVFRDILKSFYYKFFRGLHSLEYPTPLAKPIFFKDNSHLNWINQLSYKKTIYIVSPMQRSGTNFLSKICELHDEIQFPNSPDMPSEHFIYSFSNLIYEYVNETTAIWTKWINSNNDHHKEHFKNIVQEIGFSLIKYLHQFIDDDKILLLRTPDAFNFDKIFQLFPNTYIILIVRDGRDTVESFVNSFAGDWAFKESCKRWSHRINLIYDYFEGLNKEGRNKMKIVNYENLNNETFKEVRKMLEFLDLDKDKYQWDKLRKIPVIGSSTLKSNPDEDMWHPKSKDDQFKPSEKWLNWTKKKKRIFKKYAGDALIRAGYASDSDW